MSGIGYPWNLNAREEEEEDEDPRVNPRARNVRVENPTPTGKITSTDPLFHEGKPYLSHLYSSVSRHQHILLRLNTTGYLPYNEHFALNSNHVNPEGHYRRMYERPQYPFGPTPQLNRDRLGPTPQLDRATRLVRAAPQMDRASYPFGSNYQADRSSALGTVVGFSPERIISRSVVPSGQSPDRMSGSPMDRLLAVGTNGNSPVA